MRTKFFAPVCLLVFFSIILLSGVLGRFTGIFGGHTRPELHPAMTSPASAPIFRTGQTAPSHVPAKKENAPKMDMSYLQKTWGLECKSQKVEHSSSVDLRYGSGGWQITFRLEFTRDVNPKEMMREQLTAREPKSSDSALWFYFFDSENVMIYKTPPNKIEGEVSGVKGDSFRVSIISLEATMLDKTQKIEVRPGEKEKKK
jgi:hypothetical protein